MSNVHILGNAVTVDANEWLVVYSYNQKFIVKPVSKELTTAADQLRVCLEQGSPLHCEDAIDYATPFRPVQTSQGIGVTRDNIVVPIDMAVDALRLYLIITGGYALSELQEHDRAAYKKVIEETLGNRKRARMGQSPLGGVSA